MLVSIGLIIIGLFVLFCGGELLLRGAVSLAKRAHVTPAVIGLTVVAAGTSVPELAVSLIAAIQGSDAVAIGNVVGSNIFNIAFILGIAAVIRPMAITGNTIKLEYPVLLLTSLLFVILANDAMIGRLDAFFFLASYVAFTAYLVSLVRKQLRKEEKKALREEVEELVQEPIPGTGASLSLALICGGIALLAAGAHSTVSGAIDLGRFFGLSETVIGLTIVAAGTGLPEVMTSLVASMRGRDEIAIGNVIGSNIFNILGVLGISALVRPIEVPPEILSSDNWWMLGLTALLFPILITGKKISRGEGILFLVIYVAFLGMLLSRADT